MSLVYRRFFAISLPTVAAFLSILWLRNRRKGRHLPADRSAPDCLNKLEDEESSEDLVLVCDIKENNTKADLIDCTFIEDCIASDIVSGLCESCNISIKDSLLSSNSSEVSDNVSVVESCEILKADVSFLNYSINQAFKEVYGGSKDLNISEPEENSNSSEELNKIESEETSSRLDLVEIPAETEKVEIPAAIEKVEIPAEIENKTIENIPQKIDMKKAKKEQKKEAVNTMDIDKIKETGQLAEKLASLELDQMKIEDGKSGSERDSANHSPSEVMLASPSISNFSDAHSEGSSDSGKGQSDVAISPVRTPPGGSSLAGEQAPSVYEFVLPQVIVGRLIGRHGVFLNEIKSQTHTNIFIKRHPDSNKLKVCAIEGTQQDIDKALAKIRQKFPLRRFPQLTLEKVSFVQVNPLPPLKPEDFHLQLVEGVNNDVVLSSLISAAHFFLQQPSHPSYCSLSALNTVMTQIYSSGEAPPLEAPVNYAVCAAPAIEGWYRAQIVQVEEDGVHCTVKYLDYGGYSRIPATELRQIRGDLLALPFQAVECYLANVSPAGEEWSEEARMFVHTLTCGQILHAQVYDYAEDGAPLVYLYSSFGNQVVLINEQLVVNGYAVIAEQQGGSCCGTASEDGGRTDEEATKSERETE